MEPTKTILEAVRSARVELQEKAKAEAAKANTETVAFKALDGNSELGVIRLVAASAGSPDKLDKDGEFFSKGDLVKMGFDFCSDAGRTFKANHGEEIDVKLVESIVGAPIIVDKDATKAAKAAAADAPRVERMLKADEALTQDMEVVAINIEKGNETHWIVTVKPESGELVELAKAGGIAGASVGVLCNKTEV